MLVWMEIQVCVCGAHAKSRSLLFPLHIILQFSHHLDTQKEKAELLMFLHHKNLVCLMGYCDKDDVTALIYEYMANGNIHQKLSEKNSNVLKWKERLQTAVDAAHGLQNALIFFLHIGFFFVPYILSPSCIVSIWLIKGITGLDYLHNGCKPTIIQRDLKTFNILLNEFMQAKIADFELSRAFANDVDSHISTLPAGTPGYLDPQFQTSRKSDIYSFGIILFELITGKPAVIQTSENCGHILEWVVPFIEEGGIQNIMDPRLEGNFSTVSAQKAIEVAMSCIPPAVVQRPDISHILAELQECLNLEMIHGRSPFLLESQITKIFAR